ncbi:hypothetical protein [Virgisporangium aliadipatigenens]|uniref:hypothetical protein n=1 Tax=Virgisporangium aliadipatigenens TaxID=741659 RepID=UPI0019454A61|nr:hypothetical protein [Virgisporangium aliadipatigenens]
MKQLTRRVATFGAATLALAAAVLVGTGGTAQAIAAPVLVVNSSTGGSPVSDSATATCPAGTSLVGTGGRIEQTVGSGNVVMTDVIPNVGAGTVTVWGHENGVYFGNWTVVAIAVCDQVLGPVLQVAATSANNAVSPKSMTPFCPGATRLTGLGYQLRGGNGQVFPNDIMPNGIIGSILTAYASPGYAANWELTGYALCAPVPAGAAPLIVANGSGPGVASPRDTWSGWCPAGTMLTGTGAELNNAFGNVIIDQMNPNAPITEAHAQAAEPAPFGAPWGLVSYAICW